MANRLRPIDEPPGFDPLAAPPIPQAMTHAPAEEPEPIFATTILFTALKALSQRALVAVGNLFVLACAASAFWLWRTVLVSPSIQQLVGLGLYGLLMLALVHLVLRRR